MEIKLPTPCYSSSLDLSSALIQRQTKREYLTSPLSLKNLSSLLFAGQGRRGEGTKLTAPSAQEQYPFSIYIIANNVCDIQPGIYQFDKSGNAIKMVSEGHFGEVLEQTAIGEQPWVGDSAAIILLVADQKKMMNHFSAQPPVNKRGERYVYIETGAIAQNIQLQATALSVGMVLVGGFDDDRVKQILDLPSDFEPTALLCIGNI